MKLKKLTALLGALIIFSNTAFANEESVQPLGHDSSYEIFTKLMTYASQLYIDDSVTPEELINNAFEKAVEDNPEFLNELLKAGFSSLDPYSEYYTAEEFSDYINNLNHIFYGIGVVIQKKEEYIEITQCMDDGSAIAAGILPGDVIYAVDGVSAVGISLDKVQGMITGELGTMVSVTVLRDGNEITFDLERQPVSDTTVYSAVFEGNIGYLGIINFAQKTDIEFENALKSFDEQGVSNIILDLRYNPGGYLISAVNIAKLIVPEGIIVRTMFRQEENNETFYSELKDPKYKFAVLVNQDSASAAEVLSGAMQDSGIGYLIGETTYGKAVIQEMYRMENGAFKITTGHYLTRDGHEINKKGIEPDVKVELPTELYSRLNLLTLSEDVQLAKAMELMKEKVGA